MEDLTFANENKSVFNEMTIRFFGVTENTKLLTIFHKIYNVFKIYLFMSGSYL